jgi:hypothetical protein
MSPVLDTQNTEVMDLGEDGEDKMRHPASSGASQANPQTSTTAALEFLLG